MRKSWRDVKVEIIRGGGLAGVRLRGLIDTAQLPSAAAAQAEAALRNLPFGRPAAPPPHPDAFQYQITWLDAEGAPSLVLDERELPEALHPLIDAAIGRGEIM